MRIQRWAFTAGFIGSMAATIYVSMVLHSYILSVVFAVIQVLFPYLSCFHFIMLCDGIICTVLLQRMFFGFVSGDVRNFIRLKPGTHKIGGG